MLVGINCGHTESGPGSGAVGIINESRETRKVGYELIKKLNEKGISTVDCTIDKAPTQARYLARTVEKANSYNLDYFISIHFNSGGGKGVEVYTYDGKKIEKAVRVCDNIASLGFINRGIKNGSGLYVIRRTKAKAMLIEVCFVDSSDAYLYLKVGSEKIAEAIANAIANEPMKDTGNVDNGIKGEGSGYDMKKIVRYKGDIDSLPAVIVSQKYKCPMMKEKDFEESDLRADEVIVIGGKPDSNRYETLKEAAKLV